MGQDFHDRFASSRGIYEEASDALGMDLRRLCFTDDDRLALTEYAQPALLTTEIAMLRGLAEGFGVHGAHFGGHSLGEYTALVAAGVVPLADAVRIVRERGRLMQAAVPVGAGRMVAVVGRSLDRSVVTDALAGLEVVVANDNSPDQVVLSGRSADVARALQRLDGRGLRLVELEVSAPFHSPLMAPIEPAFAAVLAAASDGWDVRHAPAVTSNLIGGFHAADPALVRSRLVHQISGTVRWRENMEALAARSQEVIEVGPGRPLRGFFQAIGISVLAITDLRSAERLATRRAAA
jgi:[acyl-carrier-protein] S-malonyltransferase/trans-AT polyketide synthase/acyltransferase/oxidoreductase domain-containing protein